MILQARGRSRLPDQPNAVASRALLQTPTRRVQLTSAVLAALLLSAMMAPSPTSGATPDLDITETRRGRVLAEAAAARFTDLGVVTAPESLVVLDYGSDGHMIVPRGAQVLGPGSIITSPHALSRLQAQRSFPSLDGTMAPAPMATSEWKLVSDLCFTRRPTGEHWMDTCYHLRRLTNDGNSTHDYYGLAVFATAHSPRLESAYVSSRRCCGATQAWFDWDLRGDVDTSCRSITLGLSAFGFGFTRGHTQCEKWDITKGAAAGEFRNTWLKNSFGWVDGDRETAFMIGVKVPQGGWPQWYIDWNVDWW